VVVRDALTSRRVRLSAICFAVAVALPVYACRDSQWRRRYPAPYSTASSEEDARIWKRSDEVFRDRTDWLNEPDVPERDRVYPKPLQITEPTLPAALRGQIGKVTIGYIVEKDGGVRDVRLLFSTNHRLDDVCLSGARTWRYVPGTAAGQPSLWRYQHTCEFR